MQLAEKEGYTSCKLVSQIEGVSDFAFRERAGTCVNTSRYVLKYVGNRSHESL